MVIAIWYIANIKEAVMQLKHRLTIHMLQVPLMKLAYSSIKIDNKLLYFMFILMFDTGILASRGFLTTTSLYRLCNLA